MRRSSCSRGGIAAWSGCHDPPASTRNALEGGTVIFQSHILPEHDIRPYSVPQLAERWGCSDSMIRKLINEGELQSFRIGVLIRISAAEVERYEKCPAEPTSPIRSEEHTSELQSLMRISYAVFCLKKKKLTRTQRTYTITSHVIRQI